METAGGRVGNKRWNEARSEALLSVRACTPRATWFEGGGVPPRWRFGDMGVSVRGLVACTGGRDGERRGARGARSP